MSILVTGGTGFLGSYLVRYLVDEQGRDDVVVFDKYVDLARLGDAAGRVRVIEGDVGDAGALAAVAREHRVDAIAHLASLLGNPRGDQLAPYVQAVCGGFVNVMVAAQQAGARRVLFASSVAAYGTRDQATYTESEPAADQLMTEEEEGTARDAYGASKLWSEAMGRYCSRILGTDFLVLRFGSTFGLGRSARGSYRSGLVNAPNSGHFMARVERAAQGHAIVMPNDAQIVDWTYAADAAHAAWLGLTAHDPPHRLYNVAAERRPIGAFTAKLRELLPDAEISSDPAEHATSEHRFMDGTRIREELGFRPRYTLETGLEDYIERLRDYQARTLTG
jgi:nucleoside-diphosphate-sugar epimerase